ncbi:MAG: mechanosensitive ion channel protein MscS [Chromatiaceae bacterium]|nr:MAG: mechanosensitive ion channel protein MscS [Chromatiaceae bacterium]
MSLPSIANRFLFLILLGLMSTQAPLATPIGTAAAPSSSDTGEETAETLAPVRDLGFDPALVGLPSFDLPRRSADDYERLLDLIDARIDEIEAAATAPAAAISAPATAAEDPRLPLLRGMRNSVRAEALLVERAEQVSQALALAEQELAAFAEDGAASDPPYPVSLVDQLRAELEVLAQSAAQASRLAAQAEQRAQASERALEAAMRERRRRRDLVAQAEDPIARAAEERELDATRLQVLVAFQTFSEAAARRKLSQRESELARTRAALFEARIAFKGDALVFSEEALNERLEELARRIAEFDARTTALQQTADRAELELVATRERLEQALAENDSAVDLDLLQAQVAAQEAEVVAARLGVDYLRRAIVLAEQSKPLIERRYHLLRGEEAAQWPTWLRETQALLREVATEREFAESELASLRSMQLVLSRRLTAPDLDTALRAALTRRMEALREQESRAAELLAVDEVVVSLAQRLEQSLAPRVAERSLGQLADEAQATLAGWWTAELFAIQDQPFYVNEIITALLVFVLVVIAVSFLQRLLRRRVLPRLDSMQGSGRTSHAVVLALIRQTSQVFVILLAFYLSMLISGLGAGRVQQVIGNLLVAVFYFQVGLWANAGLMDYLQRQRSKRERHDPGTATGFGLLMFFLRILVWVVVVVSIMAHFRYPVAGVLGALGVGGIAVAFAVQNILGDVFNSMGIVLDKPFRVGDFIVAGDNVGVIEYIGVKTTRIRSLSGELVAVSNTNLVNSNIRNFKHMRERRVVFKIGVVYQTPPEQLERIPGMIEQIIRAQARCRFDRAHFFEYGDFALVFEIVYYVIGADYNLYMDIQQAINLGIYRAFQAEGIQFAYPTQELILRRSPPPPPSPSLMVRGD